MVINPFSKGWRYIYDICIYMRYMWCVCMRLFIVLYILYIHTLHYITLCYVTLHTICLGSHSEMDDHTFHRFFHVLTMALSWNPPVKFRVSLGKALVLVNQTSFQAFLPAGWGLDDPKNDEQWYHLVGNHICRCTYIYTHTHTYTHDMTWHDMTWHDMTWHDMTWHTLIYIYICSVYIYIYM